MNINIYNPYVRQEMELYHHGILGQRWGKKNGPPYPLGASDHSASEKKAGWRKSLSERREANSYERKLNKLDKTISKHTATRDLLYNKGSALTKRHRTKIDKIKSTSKDNAEFQNRRANENSKYDKKWNKIDKKLDLSENAIRDAESKTKRILEEMSSKGYGFKTSQIDRIALGRGRTAVGSALDVIGMVSIANGITTGNLPLAGVGSLATGIGSNLVTSSKNVLGNKYKVNKGSDKGTIHKHESQFTVTDEDDEFRKARKRVQASRKSQDELDAFYRSDSKARELQKKTEKLEERYHKQIENPYVSMATINKTEKQYRDALDTEYKYVNRKRIENMRNSGATYAEIAKRLGMGESMVSYYLNS